MRTHTKNERLLSIEGLSLSYGAKKIFRDINLHVDNIVRPNMSQGQVIALLGPSGVGKTQLFRCIAGLQAPSSGAVGLTPQKTPVKAGDVGVVFQNYPLLQHRTIVDNLKIAAKRHGKPAEEVTKLLDHFGLASKAKSYPLELSGGQQQRVAIIQQLLCSSNFILMDEPFSGLDVVMRQRAVQLIKEVSTVHEHNTLIVTTHDIPTALEIADTIWVLGFEKTEAGERVPGATVMAQVDLIERGLAWTENVEKHTAFYPSVLELNALFQRIS